MFIRVSVQQSQLSGMSHADICSIECVFSSRALSATIQNNIMNVLRPQIHMLMYNVLLMIRCFVKYDSVVSSDIMTSPCVSKQCPWKTNKA